MKKRPRDKIDLDERHRSGEEEPPQHQQQSSPVDVMNVDEDEATATSNNHQPDTDGKQKQKQKSKQQTKSGPPSGKPSVDDASDPNGPGTHRKYPHAVEKFKASIEKMQRRFTSLDQLMHDTNKVKTILSEDCLNRIAEEHAKLQLSAICNNIIQLMRNVLICADFNVQVDMLRPDEQVTPNKGETPDFFDNWTKWQLAERLYVLRQDLKAYRTKHYTLLRQHNVMGTWNLFGTVFLTELHMLYLRQTLFNANDGYILLTQIDRDRIDKKQKQKKKKGNAVADTDNETNSSSRPVVKMPDSYMNITKELLIRLRDEHILLMYPEALISYYCDNFHSNTPGLCLSQLELASSMEKLAARWTDLELTPELDAYVNVLLYETMNLLVSPDADRLDGAEGLDNDQYKNVTCTVEFSLQLLGRMFYFEKSLDIARALHNPDQYVQLQPISYAPAVQRKLVEWIIGQMEWMKASRLGTVIKEDIVRALFRGGDVEVATRKNNGVEPATGPEVMQTTRTTMQTGFLMNKMFDSVKSYDNLLMDMNSSTSNSVIRRTVMLNVFNQHCINDMSFNWWDMVVIHENDYMECESKLKLSCNPLLVLCMNYVSLIYRKNRKERWSIMHFREPEHALLAWIECMLENNVNRETGEVEFVTILNGTFVLSNLIDLRNMFK